MLAVVFDLISTLTDPNVEAQRGSLARKTAESLGIDGDVFWALLRSSYRDRITGAYGDTRTTLARLARESGATPSEAQLEEALRIHLEAAARLRAPRDNALRVLKALRGRGYRLGLISDCSTETAEGWSASPYEPLLDATDLSCLEGVSKPDPLLYATVVDRLEVSPAHCWYVGDGGGNELEGARDAGMTPILLTNGAEASPSDGYVPDVKISDLIDVLDVVTLPVRGM